MIVSVLIGSVKEAVVKPYKRVPFLSKIEIGNGIQGAVSETTSEVGLTLPKRSVAVR